MEKFIARFTASHENFEVEQHSCITWQENSDEPDIDTLKGMIRHNTASHFFNLFSNNDDKIKPETITVVIHQIERVNF